MKSVFTFSNGTKTALLLIFFTGVSLILQAEDKSGRLTAGSYVFKYGKPWVEKPTTSSMRAGELTYKFSKEKNLKDVDAVFYYFRGGGGGTEANLQRWIGQFESPPKSETDVVEINGTKVTFLTATGTYMESSGGPFSGNKTPRAGYTMLGAIVEHNAGPVFVKLVGPEASVKEVMKPFRELVRSALN